MVRMGCRCPGPDLFEGDGKVPKDAQHRSRIRVAHPAFVLSMRHIQGVMGAVFNAPTLLFEFQPLDVAQLGLWA